MLKLKIKAAIPISLDPTGKLTKESIINALSELSKRLEEKNEKGKLLIVGGAAMILKFQNLTA